jgi:hypothetical protein
MFARLTALRSSFRGGTGGKGDGTEPGISTWDEHIEIPGSHHSGFAAFVRPGMTVEECPRTSAR